MTKKEYEQNEKRRYEINRQLEKCSFENEELWQESLKLQKLAEKYEYNLLSYKDRQAYDFRKLLVNIDKKVGDLYGKI